MKIIHTLADYYNIDLDHNTISVFFEWAGGNIQKNSACSGLDKAAYIFQHAKVTPHDEEQSAYWVETHKANDTGQNIYNVNQFQTWTVEVDLHNPALSVNEMVKLVEEVIEPNSPLGQELGQENNIGEGVVGTALIQGNVYRFKVKGEKHANSKIKKLKVVDEAKINKVNEIAEKVTPEWRLEQMYDLANNRGQGGVPSMTNMGPYMKLLSKDISDEESELLIENGLELKEVMPVVSRIARHYFSERLNSELL